MQRHTEIQKTSMYYDSQKLHHIEKYTKKGKLNIKKDKGNTQQSHPSSDRLEFDLRVTPVCGRSTAISSKKASQGFSGPSLDPLLEPARPICHCLRQNTRSNLDLLITVLLH